MRAIIWTNDARIIVKRPTMLSTQSVALYKTCKPKPRLSTHICVTRPQWVKTEKDNELPIPGRFSNQIGILDIQSTRGILRFGVIISKSLIDIIISWKLLWDQRPQTIRILHEWNTETPHFQSKRVLVPELLTCSREARLPNRLIQITRIDQTLPILIQFRPFLLTWINVNSSMDK